MRLCSTVALAAVAPALAFAGCGETSDATPAACLARAGTYLGALGEAPGEVRLGDGVPISDCLAENQQGGNLATVGASLVAAATRLNAEARAVPGRKASLQLGYLVGAAARGAEGTEGIHTDLLRRLTAAARYSPGGDPLSRPFLRTYRHGYDAGLARG